MKDGTWTYVGSNSDDPLDVKICIKATCQDSTSNVCIDAICWNSSALTILGISVAQFNQHITDKTMDGFLGALNTDRIFKCKIIVKEKDDDMLATVIFATAV
jgi:hypothetical protein